MQNNLSITINGTSEDISRFIKSFVQDHKIDSDNSISVIAVPTPSSKKSLPQVVNKIKSHTYYSSTKSNSANL